MQTQSRAKLHHTTLQISTVQNAQGHQV